MAGFKPAVELQTDSEPSCFDGINAMLQLYGDLGMPVAKFVAFGPSRCGAASENWHSRIKGTSSVSLCADFKSSSGRAITVSPWLMAASRTMAD